MARSSWFLALVVCVALVPSVAGAVEVVPLKPGYVKGIKVESGTGGFTYNTHTLKTGTIDLGGTRIMQFRGTSTTGTVGFGAGWHWTAEPLKQEPPTNQLQVGYFIRQSEWLYPPENGGFALAPVYMKVTGAGALQGRTYGYSTSASVERYPQASGQSFTVRNGKGMGGGFISSSAKPSDSMWSCVVSTIVVSRRASVSDPWVTSIRRQASLPGISRAFYSVEETVNVAPTGSVTEDYIRQLQGFFVDPLNDNNVKMDTSWPQQKVRYAQVIESAYSYDPDAVNKLRGLSVQDLTDSAIDEYKLDDTDPLKDTDPTGGQGSWLDDLVRKLRERLFSDLGGFFWFTDFVQEW